MKYFFFIFVFLFSLNFIEGAFRCDYKYSTVAKAWFKYFVIPATWFDARLRCQLEGATLASPTTPEIEYEMTHIINNYYSSEPQIFTGISATISQGDFFTIEGIPLTELSLPWAVKEPDNQLNKDNCITLNGKGEILDKPCDVVHPYICYRHDKIEKNVTECGTVDPEYYLDKRTNSCYKFHTVPRNFSRAHFACSAEGGHLAVINSEIEAKVLKDLFAKYPARKMVGNFWKDVAFVGFHALDEPMDWRTIHEGSFRCDYKYNSKANGWFKHHVVPATWYDAQLRCTFEGAALASPATPEITKEMTRIIRNFLPGQFEIFTGISARISQGDFFTVEGIPLSEFSLPWADNEPDNKDNDENCIALNGGGELLDKPCAVTRPYICYRPENSESLNSENANKCGTVDPGYRLDTRTNSCYKFHAIPRNYSRANFACSAEGGYLAVINSETEAQVIKELFNKYPAKAISGNFWKDIAFVGFYALEDSFDWITVKGRSLWELGYHQFSAGEPDNLPPGQNCGGIHRSGLLSDWWCNKLAPYICEKNPKSIAVCEAVPDEGPETEATK